MTKILGNLQDNQPIGAIILTNHNVEKLPPEAGRPHIFSIETEENVKLKLAADNEESLNRWIAIISHAAKQSDPWLDIW